MSLETSPSEDSVGIRLASTRAVKRTVCGITELPTSGPSPPGRHLVLDPEILVDRRGQANARKAVASID